MDTGRRSSTATGRLSTLTEDGLAWVLAEVSRVKRQHLKNQIVFTAVEAALLKKPAFAPPKAAAEYEFANRDASGKADTLVDLKGDPASGAQGDVLGCPGPIAADMMALLEIIGSATSAVQGDGKLLPVKLAKRTAIRVFFALLGNLKSGQWALRQMPLMERVATALGITEHLRCSALFAMRMAYLREVSVYQGGSRVTHEEARSAVIDLAVACVIPFAEYRARKGVHGLLLSAPATVDGRRGLQTPAEFARRLRELTCGLFEGVQLTSDKYRAYLCGSLVGLAGCVNPLESPAMLAQYYRTNAVYKQPTVTTHVICDSSGSSADDSSSDEDSAEISGRKRSKRMIDRYSRRRRMKRVYCLTEDIVPPANKAAEYAARKMVADVDVAVECAWEDFDAAVAALFAQIHAGWPAAILEKTATENKHKYFVRGLPRDIDFFHVANVAQVVSKFHLDCVRCFTDGRTLFCFPSYVAAAHTSMNVGMRWTSNKKDPRDTVLKYTLRGWGTCLNAVDVRSMTEYAGNVSDVSYTGRRHSVVVRRPLFEDCEPFRGASRVPPEPSKANFADSLSYAKCYSAAYL